MSNFNFDHTKETLDEAIGAEPGTLTDLKGKIDVFAKGLLKKKVTKVSRIIEASLNEFSYSELIIISALFTRKIILEAEKQKIGEKNKNKSKGSSRGPQVKVIDVNGQGESALEDLPDEVREALRDMLNKLGDKKKKKGSDDESEDSSHKD